MKIQSLLGLFLSVGILFSCQEVEFENDFEVITPNDINIDASGKASAPAGQVFTLSANGDNTVWSSSNDEVVSISGNTARARKPGTAKITGIRTVNQQQFSDSFTITVEEQNYVYTLTDKDVPEEESTLLNLEIKDENGNITTPKNIVWTSNDTGIATIENNILTGVKEGKLTITANVEIDNITYAEDFDFTITEFVDVFKLSITSNQFVKQGEDLVVTYTITNQRDETFSGTNTKLTSKDTSILSVENNKVSGIAIGKTKLTLTTTIEGNELSETIDFSVIGFNITNTTKTTIDVSEGPQDLTLSIVNENGTSITANSINWTSNDTNIATINNQQITPVKQGNTNLTASITIDDIQIELSFDFTITKYSIQYTGKRNFEVGDTENLTAIVKNGNQIINDINPITWNSDDNNIISIDGEQLIAESAGNTNLIIQTTINNVIISTTISMTVEEPQTLNISGNLENINGYDASGTFEIKEENNNIYIELKNYSVDGIQWGLYLSTDNNFSRASDLTIAVPIPNSGTETWEIPKGTNIDDYSYIIISCERINRAVAVGKL